MSRSGLRNCRRGTVTGDRTGLNTFATYRGANAPARVDLRTEHRQFNHFWEFALVDGGLLTRPREAGVTWRSVRLPSCLNGAITAISLDDDELVGIDRDGSIYTMDNVTQSPLLWNWTSACGAGRGGVHHFRDEPLRRHVHADTLAELLAGLRRLPNGRRRSSVTTRIETALQPYCDTRSVLSFDDEAADRYADILVARENAGLPITMADAEIAAICRAHAATCATRNTKDFAHTGIELVNPWIA